MEVSATRLGRRAEKSRRKPVGKQGQNFTIFFSTVLKSFPPSVHHPPEPLDHQGRQAPSPATHENPLPLILSER